MTLEQLAAIKAHIRNVHVWDEYHPDLHALVAEVERLRGVAEETYRLVRLARPWIGDNAPASVSKALDDYVFTHPMKSAAESGE